MGGGGGRGCDGWGGGGLISSYKINTFFVISADWMSISTETSAALLYLTKTMFNILSVSGPLVLKDQSIFNLVTKD